MKKFLMLFLLSLSTISYNCNLCFDVSSQKLGKNGYKQVQCNCECYKYFKSKHKDGHRCTECEHRLLPWNPKKLDQHEPVFEVDPIFINIGMLKTGIKTKNPFKQNKLYTYAEKQPTKQTKFSIVLLDDSKL